MHERRAWKGTGELLKGQEPSGTSRYRTGRHGKEGGGQLPDRNLVGQAGTGQAGMEREGGGG